MSLSDFLMKDDHMKLLRALLLEISVKRVSYRIIYMSTAHRREELTVKRKCQLANDRVRIYASL
jgi:hypothetical protein